MQHGTCVYVLDLICIRCSAVSRFDGADASVFAATEYDLYSEDHLDFWLYTVACLDGSFREAYELSLLARRQATMHLLGIGRRLEANRRAAITLLAYFIKTLHVPAEIRCHGFSAATIAVMGMVFYPELPRM